MKLFAHIRSRVLVLAILPALMIAVLLTAHATKQSLSELDNGLHERGRTIALQLAAAAEYGVVSGNAAILRALVQQTMNQGNAIQSVMVIDNLGRTLAVSGKPVLPQTVHAESTAAMPGEWDGEGHMMFSAPVTRGEVQIDDYNDLLDVNEATRNQVVGQVYVVLATANLAELKERLVGHNLLIGLVGLALSGLLGWRIGRGIALPIHTMAGAVDKIADGQLDARVAEASPGELGALERGFNTMASRLQQAHGTMQERIDEATQQLRYQARHDVLTGLVNRREIEARLERALGDARENGTQHVFCYMDLDQFKIVNDTCGHHAGDALLRQLSLILRQRVREVDTLARLGGDEFGLLLENCSIVDARRMSQELLDSINAFRFVHEDKIFGLGVSIGMVAITAQTPSVESLLSASDSACFAAKDNGRNRIHLFEPEDGELARRQGEMQWIARIKQALEENRFCLYCQPILPLAAEQHQPRYFEILLRKIGDEGKIIPPMAFIPAAERFHMMPAIDRWVIRHAFSAYRRLLDRHGSEVQCVFTINLSGVSLGDPELLDYIMDQLILHGVPPTGICFEITETAAIVNLAQTMELIKTLKEVGCGFLLDDFGSGMSSFAYLKNLPVDFIKIDGTFVRDIATNPIDLAMVQSIHGIARAMQIKTIAEFVESAAAMEMLRAMGVHYGQGYHLGKPIPVEQAIEQLDRSSLNI
jgi:diguanylate cyclase (GGDEF)-like protein